MTNNDEEQAVDQTQPGDGTERSAEETPVPQQQPPVADSPAGERGDPTEVIEPGDGAATSEPTEVLEPTSEAPTSEPTAAGVAAWVTEPSPGPAGAPPEAAAAEAEPVQPTRPRGPHAPTVLLGLICLLLAALVVASQSADVTVDWALLGPGAIVGAGVVLVLLGLAGLLSRRER